MNYYSLLGLSSTATPTEIKAGYLKKAKEFHPDLQKTDKKSAEENFKKIVEAYSVLSDEIKKRDYDESLKPKAKPSAGSYTQANYSYPHENFHGKASSPKYDEEFYKEFHKVNIKNRMDAQGSFWVRNIEMIIITGLAIALYVKWLFVYNEHEKARHSMLKTETERLNPNEAEDEGVYVDYSVPLPQHKKLSREDCEGLDIQALESLDRLGYKLPADAKEMVMEFRETQRVHAPRNRRGTSWNYNDAFNNNNNRTPQAPQNQPLDAVQHENALKAMKIVTQSIVIEDEKEPEPKKNNNLQNNGNNTSEENNTNVPRMRTGQYQKEKHF